MRPMIPRTDPAPSRLSYRLERMRLTPAYRRLFRLGLPMLVIAGLVGGYLADAERRNDLGERFAEIRRQIETRPEFMVHLLALEGASASVQEDIHEIFPYDLPASSFDIDLQAIRAMVEELPAVARANVRIRQGGILAVDITERVPVALWRTRTGIDVLDITGAAIASIEDRTERHDLPVLTGEGADRSVAQALDILAAAAALRTPVRGLVRMGERRWDLVLDDGKRVLLPETEPVRALERVIVLDKANDMLERDLVTIDMRLGARPTVRLSEAATEEWWRITSARGATGNSSGADGR
ncbi:cell division protein FtsQ/DivIB [Roseovarius autotrophicus]|uniref:cell division protein FtsQ/DivIB n=1 Tax=Roseovarius autotrophicus TaxID=2824121 RepID=UPI0019E0AFCC|nr:cell division protein FtsQ/DivIB [Roseovarius autotrophicus]MBE0454076.1 cell division protein FtsQ/DivIB [Roseovarius sp.]